MKKNDLIDMTLDMKKFINILKKKSKVECDLESFNVVLNGRWGDGKTTFINSLFEYNNKQNDKNKLDVFKIDAWDYDYLDDPSEMIYHFLNENKNDIFKAIGKSLNTSAKKYPQTKIPLLKIFNDTREDELKKIPANKRQLISIKELHENIKTAVQKIEDNAYIFIDNLDRCNPNFIVKLIELIKHIFNIKNITIIYILDWENVNSSIMNYYGINNKRNNGELYLSKLIDYKWDLFHLSKEEFLFNKYAIRKWEETEKNLYISYSKKLTFREAELLSVKYFKIWESISWPELNYAFQAEQNYWSQLHQIICEFVLFALTNEILIPTHKINLLQNIESISSIGLKLFGDTFEKTIMNIFNINDVSKKVFYNFYENFDETFEFTIDSIRKIAN